METTALARPRATGHAVAETVVYASVLAGGVGASLVALTERVLFERNSLAPVLVVFLGTLVVYNIDRLRDRDRDRNTAPERTRFVEVHRDALRGVVAIAGLLGALLLLPYGAGSALAFTPILGLGLLHRRLKRWPFAKAVYVAVAWTTAVLIAARLPGPVATAPSPAFVAVLALSLLANTAVTGSQRMRRGGALVAALCGTLAAGLALLEPTVAGGVVCLPLGALAALRGGSETECLRLARGGSETEWVRLARGDATLGLGALAALVTFL